MPEKGSQRKRDLQSADYKLVYVLPSQNADLPLWMDLPLQAKRRKPPSSNILYSMWVNNTFQRRQRSSQRWISAVIAQYRSHVKVIYSGRQKKKNADLTNCSSQMQPPYQKVDYSGHALDPRVIAPSDRDAPGCCSLEMFPQAFRRPVRSAAHWLDTGLPNSGDGDERRTLSFNSSVLRCYADSCDYATSIETWKKML
jgi:hypothetical protein